MANFTDLYFDLKDESTPEFLEMTNQISRDFNLSQSDAVILWRGFSAVGGLLNELPSDEKQTLLITFKQVLQQNPNTPMLTHVSALQDFVREIHQRVINEQ